VSPAALAGETAVLVAEMRQLKAEIEGMRQELREIDLPRASSKRR
jgi:hypothetical protein